VSETTSARGRSRTFYLLFIREAFYQ